MLDYSRYFHSNFIWVKSDTQCTAEYFPKCAVVYTLMQKVKAISKELRGSFGNVEWDSVLQTVLMETKCNSKSCLRNQQYRLRPHLRRPQGGIICKYKERNHTFVSLRLPCARHSLGKECFRSIKNTHIWRMNTSALICLRNFAFFDSYIPNLGIFYLFQTLWTKFFPKLRDDWPQGGLKQLWVFTKSNASYH